MKKVFAMLVFLLLATISSGQCPPGSIVLNSQAAINDFAITYPDCSFIAGDVTVSGPDITDLTGLSGISSIGGQLLIENCDLLTTLSNWDEVALLGPDAKLTIQHNDALESLTDIFGVLNAGLVLNNLNSLTSIKGLSGISSAGLLNITNCNVLTNLTGLENLAIANQLTIESNLLLSSVAQLNSVIGPLESLQVHENPSLVSIGGLEGITKAALITISDNSGLLNLEGLDGLANSPDDSCEIIINGNTKLINISALNGIAPESVTFLELVANSNLAVCSETLICDLIELGAAAIAIIGNAGGCESVDQVQAACSLSVNSQDEQTQLVVSPNPVNEFLNIELPNNTQLITAIFYDFSGKVLVEQKRTSIDLTTLNSGLYFVKIITNQGIVNKTIFKR